MRLGAALVACVALSLPPGLARALEADDVAWGCEDAGYVQPVKRDGQETAYRAMVLLVHTDWGVLPATAELPEGQLYTGGAPVCTDLDGDGRAEVVTAITGPAGAWLTVYGKHSGPIASTGPVAGGVSIVGGADMDGDGTTELAWIEDPGGVGRLHVDDVRDGALVELASAEGFADRRAGQQAGRRCQRLQQGRGRADPVEGRLERTVPRPPCRRQAGLRAGAGRDRSGRAGPCRGDGVRHGPARGLEMTRPLVGIAASHHLAEDTYEVQMTGRRTIDAVGEVADCLPMLIPGLPEALDIGDLIATVDGIVLTGARANIHPSHYGDELTEAHGLMDEGRDAVTLPLVRAALEHGVPILGLCKGIQEMNVALGGTLYPEVGDLPGRHRHRMPKGCKDPKVIFELRERVRLRPGGELARIVGADSIVTNSLHGQAVREPGERVVIEGWAADETVEAISIDGARAFALGVQWHAEYDAGNDPVSRAIFRAFGAAVRARRARRVGAAA